jgi:hypothetical protein
MTDKVEELLTRVSALEAAVGIGHNGGPQLDDEVPPANDVRLSKNATAKRYSVSPRTIERMRTDPTLGFPQPDIINGRWWFWLSKLQAFDRMRARMPLKPRQPLQLKQTSKPIHKPGRRARAHHE